MEEETKKDIVKIVLSGILLVVAILIEKFSNFEIWQYLLIFLIPYLIVGFDVLKEAVEKLVHGEFLEEEFLMSVATIGALAIGFLPNTETMFHEAVFVMLFFKIGELFEEIAEGKSEKSIEELIKLRPDYANLLVNDKVEKVDPETVKVGDIIEVYPGEKVPLDGTVISGNSSVNTAALTGESVPRTIKENEIISAGFVNLTSNIKIKVTKKYEESTFSKIIDMVKNATDNKSKSERFITKFARFYTPIVVFLAVAISIIPPLIHGNFMEIFPTWLVRGLTFLVVSCPCALVVSVPLAFMGGIGALSRHGILVKGSSHLETLTALKNIAFDKTGTLTQGVFEVVAIHPEKYDEEKLLHLSAHVERYSKHPIAISLKQAFKNEDDDCEVKVIEDISGYGIKALVNKQEVVVGNSKLMEKLNIEWKPCHHVGTIVHVAIDNEYAGHIVISDKIKEDSKEAVEYLNKNGINTIMLTGDHEEVAKDFAEKLSIKKFYAELLPQDKVDKVEEILKNTEKSGKTAFVGDGINDAPVIAKADIGVAMGALGQDAAIEVADVVLMDDKVSKLVDAIKISKKTRNLAIMNIWFAEIVKFVVLIMAFLGHAPMWLAVFADVGVTVIAVLNSMRALRF